MISLGTKPFMLTSSFSVQSFKFQIFLLYLGTLLKFESNLFDILNLNLKTCVRAAPHKTAVGYTTTVRVQFGLLYKAVLH